MTFNCDYVRRQDGRILSPLGLNLTSDAPWKAIYISTHTEYGLYIFASLCYLPFLLISISFFYFYECQCVRICFTNLYRMTSIGLDHTYRHTYTWRLESCVARSQLFDANDFRDHILELVALCLSFNTYFFNCLRTSYLYPRRFPEPLTGHWTFPHPLFYVTTCIHTISCVSTSERSK